MPFSTIFRFRLTGLTMLVALILATVPKPAQAQDRFRERNYRVRIAVADNIERVALQGQGPYQVLSSEGKPLAQLYGWRPYFIQVMRGHPGERIYRLVLREMSPHQVDSAINVAKAAKELYQQPVKVFRVPTPDRRENRILVTLGDFDSLEAAREFSSQVTDHTVEWIYEDRARAEGGQVRLIARDGSILARDDQFLRLVPLDVLEADMSLAVIESEQFDPKQLSDARHYRGEIELAINEEGTLSAVNDLWIEHYLYSVVAAEIGTDASMESLKAQAVAARSEAVAKIERGIVSSELFDFYDTALAQAYPGKKSETARVRRAVDETRGEILVWRGHAVDAVYSHSCGGVISSSKDVWGGENEGYAIRHYDRLNNHNLPDLSSWSAAHKVTSKPMNDVFCYPEQSGFPAYAKRYFRWHRSFSGKEYSELATRLYGVGRVKDVVVDRRTGSGRVAQMRIIGDDKTMTIDDELEIRNALGNIYATLFTLGKEQDGNGYLDRLDIYGAGFGHGVGMCQMGAYMMGLQGYNYRQILAHYFNNVKLRRLYR